jgi:hypothetical protein
MTAGRSLADGRPHHLPRSIVYLLLSLAAMLVTGPALAGDA